MARYVIINADDFGLTREVNRGIIEAAERGIVRSASLMVRQPAAAEAALYARRSRAISVGLHLDLGEWVLRNGEWVQLYHVVPTEDADLVSKEIERQLREFQQLMGRAPTHLDSHQHVHRNEPVRSIFLQVARTLRVPLRECTPGIHYCGDFYGQDADGSSLPVVITVPGLKRILASLPAGVTELGCHPGYVTDLQSVYHQERAEEVHVLCDPEVREILANQNTEIRSFEHISDLISL
jgi:predicted glycoside hydrolase/deacetylase ChbG (UPF0249 family)